MFAGKSLERVIILHGLSPKDNQALAAIAKSNPQFEVLETHSLDEYLAALSTQDFDVVVLDYDLPEVRAKELLAQLKLRDREPEVLLLSQCTDPATMKSMARAHKRYIVRDDGWVDSMTHAIRDMLRIRRLEEEMAQIRARLTEANQQLEARNRRLDDFCATIAHDIRGPLAGLVLKVEYILETQASHLDERTVNLLRRSVESTRRLVGVVHAMYEFAKVGFSGAKFSTTPLTPLVQEVMADITTGHSDDIGVKMHDLPVVWGNSDLLRRVFQNVFANAIKYNHRERVEISISFDGLVQCGVGEFAQISIADNGPGISPIDAGRVFNMFSRGNGADRGLEGLGIGLAIVQRIVELHKGTIELTSGPHEGARFTLLLPTHPIETVRS